MPASSIHFHISQGYIHHKLPISTFDPEPCLHLIYTPHPCCAGRYGTYNCTAHVYDSRKRQSHVSSFLRKLLITIKLLHSALKEAAWHQFFVFYCNLQLAIISMAVNDISSYPWSLISAAMFDCSSVTLIQENLISKSLTSGSVNVMKKQEL